MVDDGGVASVDEFGFVVGEVISRHDLIDVGDGNPDKGETIGLFSPIEVGCVWLTYSFGEVDVGDLDELKLVAVFNGDAVEGDDVAAATGFFEDFPVESFFWCFPYF